MIKETVNFGGGGIWVSVDFCVTLQSIHTPGQTYLVSHKAMIKIAPTLC